MSTASKPDLNRLFPNSQKKKRQDTIADILYFWVFDAGQSYESFLETPIFVITTLAEKHAEKIKRENKKHKK